MKTTIRITIASVILIPLCLMTAIGNRTYAQEKSTVIRIGVYDSRVVAIAWSRSAFFREHMKEFGKESDSAINAHDTLRIKELSVTAMSFQHLLHQTVFSNGSAGFILRLVRDQLPGLAKEHKVSIIVSKWELTYSDSDVEIIDLTNEVAQLFQPEENIDKMVKDLRKQSPIPIDQLSIEMEMMETYCERFGQK